MCWILCSCDWTFNWFSFLFYREGSTIAEYIVRAAAIKEIEIEAVKQGIFTQLGEIYPMITDSKTIVQILKYCERHNLLDISDNFSDLFFILKGSTPLELEPSEVFFGETVTLTCGPPPDNLNFSPNWIAEWRRDNILVPEDEEHISTKRNGKAILTVTRFFTTDNGEK